MSRRDATLFAAGVLLILAVIHVLYPAEMRCFHLMLFGGC